VSPNRAHGAFVALVAVAMRAALAAVAPTPASVPAPVPAPAPTLPPAPAAVCSIELRPDWVLQVERRSDRELALAVRSHPAAVPSPLPRLALPLGGARRWVADVDSAGTLVQAYGPFTGMHMAGGFETPVAVLAYGDAERMARGAPARVVQVVHADVGARAMRARILRPPSGRIAVVIAGSTSIFALPASTLLATHAFQLQDLVFADARERAMAIRSDEAALNRIVVIDYAGHVVQEHIVPRASFGAARVIDGGPWVDWPATSLHGRKLRVALDLEHGTVRTTALPGGWDRRAVSPSGGFVLALERGHLRLDADRDPMLQPQTVWSHDESSPVLEAAVNDAGHVAYHRLRNAHVELVVLGLDGTERGIATGPRRGLRFVGTWLVEGFENATEAGGAGEVRAYDTSL
jgi:hypothetical protein